MPIHVVFDARHWRDFGIGTYVRNLIQALAALDHENRYSLVVRPQDAGPTCEPREIVLLADAVGRDGVRGELGHRRAGYAPAGTSMA